MATELGNAGLEDPFRVSSLISLLPKTLGALSHAQIAASEDKELESIQNIFKSMVGKGSTQVMQQAQKLTKSCTDIHAMCPEDGSYAANCKDHQPERRPALGRKRPKFSLKPVPSHSLPNIDFTSSIDHIDDPEEYFSAFEQLENAERELKKLRGEVSADVVQHHQCTTARKRRPGLERKAASYKHHTSATADTSEDLVESQEEHLERRIPGLSNASVKTPSCNLFHPELIEEHDTSQAKNTKNKLQDAIESEVSVVEKEKKVSNLLEKLLSSFKDFDGDEGKTFLRESLQMKSIETGKICLPELGNIIQLNPHSALKSGVAHVELKGSWTSPPLTKSPLGAISTLQRRVSLKDPLKDLYSVFPSDDAPCSGDSSLSKSIGRVSISPVAVDNHDNIDFPFDGASSPVVENGIKLGFEDDICTPVAEADGSIHNNIIMEEKLTKQPHYSLERNTNPHSNGIVNDICNISSGLDGGLQKGNNIQMDHATTDRPDAAVEGLTSICSNQPITQEILGHHCLMLGENALCNSSSGDEGKDVSGGLQVEADNMQQNLLIMSQSVTGAQVLTSTCDNQTTTVRLASSPSRNMGGICRRSGTNLETGFLGLTDMSQSEEDCTVHEKVSNAAGTSKDILCPPEASVLTDQHFENISLQEKDNEEHQTASGSPPNEGSKQKTRPLTRNKEKSTSGRRRLAASGPSPNEGNKQKAPPHRRNKKKSTLRRQSLASAGMIWEDGRRKSSRRRFRPLEHWRGERLLYGRIHESLATVIGVKYVSPGKDTVKVESYVSEEYADLVAQVAR